MPTPPASTCTTSGLGDPNTCAQAVTKAKSRIHTNNDPAYDGWCDRINAQNYGFSASGSTTAYVHWTQIPSAYKHPNSTDVPAGGLAFFSNGGSGHTMISIGGGKFLSNDINGAGTLHRDDDRADQEQVGPDLPRLVAALVQGEPLTSLTF